MAKAFRVLRLLVWLALIGAGIAAPTAGSAQVQDQQPQAFLVHLDGVIDPNHAKYLDRALDQVEDEGGHLAIVRIDTPGGLLSSMRAMVERVFDAEIPVITYVGPQGARAGSAGTFVTAVGHVAVMAPGSNIGAASPISGTGEDLPATLASKVTNDAAALIRSIADARGRNPEPLEETVRKASSFTAQEALELNIIDLIASDLDDLLRQVHGRQIDVNGRLVTLDTEGIRCEKPRERCESIGLSFVERFIDVIADPTISSLLLSLGGLALVIEIFNPGLLFPGIFGVIALALAFVSFGNLPVNWAGVGLILFGIGLIFFEIQVTGFGVLGIGGIIAFILGVIFIFPTSGGPSISNPNITISPWVVASIAGGFGALFSTLVYLAWRGEPRTAAILATPIVGRTGRVTQGLDPVGTVQVGGELWTAEERDGRTVEAGEVVEVIAQDGLTLRVVKRPKLLEEGGRLFDAVRG